MSKTRNKFAIDAHFRKGGPMKSKNEYKRVKITKQYAEELLEEEKEIEDEIVFKLYEIDEENLLT
jgi:hypothetical protein